MLDVAEQHVKGLSQRASKATYVRQSLSDLATRIGPGGKLPTFRELCRSLDVAKVTLNDALTDLEARGIIDRRHGSGLFVSQRIEQRTIGLLLGRYALTQGSPFFAMLLDLCESRAETHRERFRFYIDIQEPKAYAGAPPDHRDFIKDILSGQLHGLLRTCEISADEEAWLRRHHVPAVSGTMVHVDNTTQAVNIDIAGVVRMGIEALAAQGCRRIGMLTAFGFARNLNPPYEADRRAYRETLERLGLEFRPEWIGEEHMPGWPAQIPESFGRWDEHGRRVIERLYADSIPASERPDGLVITDDVMTQGALTAIREMGLRVGHDIRIATYANKGAPVIAMCEEPMTLLQVDAAEIVEAMFAMLEHLMDGGEPPEHAVLIKAQHVEYAGLGACVVG